MKEQCKEELKIRYFLKKEEIDQIRSDETLAKWKVLSEAYKLGKKIWGSRFSITKLADDMELPRTTTKRCLSLDRATKFTWKMINEGKISAFKAAQVCQSKNITFQDDIIKEVIKNNISTSRIKGLRTIKSEKDINAWRHKIAIERGYSRKDSAYRNFKTWIERGNLFLIMKKEAIDKKKREEIENDLRKLNKKIKNYIGDKK